MQEKGSLLQFNLYIWDRVNKIKFKNTMADWDLIKKKRVRQI